jgi:hypothetical protein
MFVTACYNIYNNLDKIRDYIALFYDIAISGVPITLFTEPSLEYFFTSFPSTIKVVSIPLETFELYRIAMSYERELPTTRNVEKDTKEFFALMNTKVEFMKYAANHMTSDDKLIWIDFGILKIAKNRVRFINKLKQIHSQSFQKITIPGCWGFGRPLDTNVIHWRFCGGFIIIPRHSIERFYEHSKNVLHDFCHLDMYRLSWETNVWTVIEFCAERENMDWYFADHDDTIVLNCKNAF